MALYCLQTMVNTMYTSFIKTVAIICGIILMVASVRPVQSQDIESNPAAVNIQSVTAVDQQIVINSGLPNKSFIPLQLSPGCRENMPVYRPDDSLTNSMPQIEWNGADPGIFIPEFKQCKPFTQPFKFPEKMGNE